MADKTETAPDVPPAKTLAEAIIRVMADVRNIAKGSTVGSGNNSFKAVSDKDVKEILRKAMIKHGLAIIPKSIDAKTHIERWEETNNYGTRTKQQVFVEAKTVYTLMHVSGETRDIEGYGHGIDPQDKAAGKATTYALKYALLYLFLVPTGDIDDADNTPPPDDEAKRNGGPSNKRPTNAAGPSNKTPGIDPDKPSAATIAGAVSLMENAVSLDDLRFKWEKSLTPALRLVPAIEQAKERRKTQLLAGDTGEAIADDIPY